YLYEKGKNQAGLEIIQYIYSNTTDEVQKVRLATYYHSAIDRKEGSELISQLYNKVSPESKLELAYYIEKNISADKGQKLIVQSKRLINIKNWQEKRVVNYYWGFLDNEKKVNWDPMFFAPWALKALYALPIFQGSFTESYAGPLFFQQSFETYVYADGKKIGKFKWQNVDDYESKIDSARGEVQDIRWYLDETVYKKEAIKREERLVNLAVRNNSSTIEFNYYLKHHNAYYHLFDNSLTLNILLRTPLINKNDSLLISPEYHFNIVKRGALENSVYPLQYVNTSGLGLKYTYQPKEWLRPFVEGRYVYSFKDKNFNLHPITEKRRDPLDLYYSTAIGVDISQKKREYNILYKNMGAEIKIGYNGSYSPQTDRLFVDLNVILGLFKIHYQHEFDLNTKVNDFNIYLLFDLYLLANRNFNLSLYDSYNFNIIKN
ncbi:MAG: hypothetical protein KKA19_06495, partial [Candidatus Margulisbacteria bacterium]|nr:hypothetical protein [Candidatus Margulisiibacteriota bacterium]